MSQKGSRITAWLLQECRKIIRSCDFRLVVRTSYDAIFARPSVLCSFYGAKPRAPHWAGAASCQWRRAPSSARAVPPLCAHGVHVRCKRGCVVSALFKPFDIAHRLTTAIVGLRVSAALSVVRLYLGVVCAPRRYACSTAPRNVESPPPRAKRRLKPPPPPCHKHSCSYFAIVGPIPSRNYGPCACVAVAV